MHRLIQRYLPALLSLGMILGSFRGYVALFDEEESEPLQVFPYRIEALPPADQAALNNGIPVRSEKELAHLLEDYLS